MGDFKSKHLPVKCCLVDKETDSDIVNVDRDAVDSEIDAVTSGPELLVSTPNAQRIWFVREVSDQNSDVHHGSFKL